MDTDGILDDIEIADLSPDALTLMISQETCELMDEAIAGLPTVQQQLIDNIYFRDMSLREAADHMNISLNVLRKIHQKAIARLKELVDDADEVSVLL